jgi:polyisoprenoid-binding protein YceI
MKKVGILMLAILSSSALMAQNYVTKSGYIKFYSKMPAENIEAHNRQVNSALNVETGEFVFKLLMKSFQFEKRLMQEHFNENYVESDQYPNASFKGHVSNLEDIDFTKAGTYKALVKGKLTIHGVTKDVVEEGQFIVSDQGIRAKSVFMVKVADYDIKIPKIVRKNIAEQMEVTVDVNLKPYKK